VFLEEQRRMAQAGADIDRRNIGNHRIGDTDFICVDTASVVSQETVCSSQDVGERNKPDQFVTVQHRKVMNTVLVHQRPGLGQGRGRR
jgi:hypothetical protein